LESWTGEVGVGEGGLKSGEEDEGAGRGGELDEEGELELGGRRSYLWISDLICEALVRPIRCKER